MFLARKIKRLQQTEKIYFGSGNFQWNAITLAEQQSHVKMTSPKTIRVGTVLDINGVLSVTCIISSGRELLKSVLHCSIHSDSDCALTLYTYNTLNFHIE